MDPKSLKYVYEAYAQLTTAYNKYKYPVLMYMLLLYTKIHILCTTAFLQATKIAFCAPDYLFNVFATCTHAPRSDNNYVHILHAQADGNICTNKLKIFVSKYWEAGGDTQPHSTDGFDFNKMREFIQCTALYCTYLICANRGAQLTPEEFASGVKKLVIARNDDSQFCKITPERVEPLAFGHVDFAN
jgi:hypothetical protein